MAFKKIISENDAMIRLTAKCAGSECCVADIRKMMSRWELPEGVADKIIKRLLDERYIDEQRYAHAFVRDKFRYNHWGWIRIEQELKRRNIAQEYIDEAKEEISDEANLTELKRIIDSKRRTVKGKNEYEVNAKLFRFALSRGFSYADINEVLHTDIEE
ncbi:MAG: RecX family transcriptional regulator [Bacteroidaceae bacterium]|nr:RecX family transcriptional regulator [Bacteroidaceae bacterium]